VCAKIFMTPTHSHARTHTLASTRTRVTCFFVFSPRLLLTTVLGFSTVVGYYLKLNSIDSRSMLRNVSSASF